MVSRLRPRSARQLQAVPYPEYRRRRDARMPGGDPGHLDLWPPRGARTDGADRVARQAWHDRLRYAGTPGQVFDVPDADGALLAANGWTFVSPSGLTSARPTGRGDGANGQRGPGTRFLAMQS